MFWVSNLVHHNANKKNTSEVKTKRLIDDNSQPRTLNHATQLIYS